MARIFLSHSSENDAGAIALRDWLIKQGWDDLFLDLDPERGLKAGARWQAALKAAANACELVIFLISPAWAASKWCLGEFMLAQNLNKRIVGVIIEPTPFADLPVEMTAEWQLVDLTGGEGKGGAEALVEGQAETVAFAEDGLDRLRIGLMEAGLDARYFPWPPEHDPDRAPYRGLEPLQAEDAGIFFGRDGPTVTGLDTLRGLRDAAPPRLLVILGASGAGKSSFLRAGLLPRLARERQHFMPLPVIRPERAVLHGESGLVAALETALKQAGRPRTRTGIRKAIEAGPPDVAALLKDLVRAAAGPSGDDALKAPSVIIAVDQAEELFGAEGAGEADAFIGLLGQLAAHDDPALIVVFTIRSDGYEHLQTARGLEGIRQHTLSLPPMPKGAYAEVIKGPARRLDGTKRALKVDDDLVDALLADIEEGGSRDALPLLAFTLERLYREAGAEGDLKLDEYEELGRVKGSIEAAVERVLKAAGDDPKIPRDRSARLVLLRRGLIPWLAGIDPDTGAPRRRVARRSEIPEESAPLIEVLVYWHLLRTDVADGDEPGEAGNVTIEPVHEALLRQWGLLQGWLEEDAGLLSLLEGVQRAARDWAANDKDEGWLTHLAGRLEDAEDLKQRADLAAKLDAGDEAYLAACRAADTARRNRELDEAKKLAEANRKIAKRTRVGLIAASVLALVAVGLAAFGFVKAREARVKAAEVQSALGAALIERAWPLAERRTDLATRYALAGLEAAPGNEALGRAALARLRHTNTTAMHTADGSQPAVNATLNSDGSRLATVDVDGRAFVFDATTGAMLFRLPTARKILTAGFSSKGHRLVTVYANGGIGIWNAIDGEPVVQLGGNQDRVSTAEFSPDGTRLLTAGDDGTARLWDPSDGVLIAKLAGHSDRVDVAVFSSDGTKILTASADHTARVWDAVSGNQLVLLRESGSIYVAAFSPDGALLVTAANDLTLTVWSAASGISRIRIRHPQALRTVSISNDSKYVLADDFAGNFLTWRIADGRLARAFDGAALGVGRGLYRGDGELFLGAGPKIPAIAWEPSTGHVIAALDYKGTGGRILAIGPDGDRAAVGLYDGRVIVWDFSRALSPLIELVIEACSRLTEKTGGRRFSSFEIASDPLIDEAWLHGDYKREVCKPDAGGA